MKKFVLAMMIVSTLLLCACEFSDYKKAVSAMQQENYQTAHEIFQTISEYKDSAELSSECVYQMAIEALSLEDHETAYGLFNDISGYKDAAQKAEESSIFLGYQSANAMKEDILQAVTERDEELLSKLVIAYLTMDHAHNEISVHMNDYVIETICAQFEVVDYENYLFLDRIIALSDNNEMLMSNIGDRLAEFDAAHSEQRTIAFLTGTWKRIDSTQSSGLRISVVHTEENTFAMILEDLTISSAIIKSVKFQWEKGMLIWNDIQITDPAYITMDTMWLTNYYNLGVQSNRYEDCVGYLDYDGMRIITQSTGEENIPWRDKFDSDIYVKESVIKETPAFSEADFQVSIEETNDTYEAGNLNLNEWLSATNKLFYAYSGVNSMTTTRGISVGSKWSDVIEQYGYGRGNLFVEGDDAIHKSLKKTKLKDNVSGELLCDILSSQADEYMEYSLNDTTQKLRFYFNDGIVSWICFYTA